MVRQEAGHVAVHGGDEHGRPAVLPRIPEQSEHTGLGVLLQMVFRPVTVPELEVVLHRNIAGPHWKRAPVTLKLQSQTRCAMRGVAQAHVVFQAK